MKRDDLTEAEVLKRMSFQFKPINRIKAATYVITNDDESSPEEQVNGIHSQLTLI